MGGLGSCLLRVLGLPVRDISVVKVCGGGREEESDCAVGLRDRNPRLTWEGNQIVAVDFVRGMCPVMVDFVRVPLHCCRVGRIDLCLCQNDPRLVFPDRVCTLIVSSAFSSRYCSFLSSQSSAKDERNS